MADPATASVPAGDSTTPPPPPAAGGIAVIESTGNITDHSNAEEETIVDDESAHSNPTISAAYLYGYFSESDTPTTSDGNTYLKPCRIPCIPRPYDRFTSVFSPCEDEFLRCCSCGRLQGHEKLHRRPSCSCCHQLESCENQGSNRCGIRRLGWICWACNTANTYTFDDLVNDDFQRSLEHNSREIDPDYYDIETCVRCRYSMDGACPLALIRGGWNKSGECASVWAEWY